jgi:hypothetical protein
VRIRNREIKGEQLTGVAQGTGKALKFAASDPKATQQAVRAARTVGGAVVRAAMERSFNPLTDKATLTAAGEGSMAVLHLIRAHSKQEPFALGHKTAETAEASAQTQSLVDAAQAQLETWDTLKDQDPNGLKVTLMHMGIEDAETLTVAKALSSRTEGNVQAAQDLLLKGTYAQRTALDALPEGPAQDELFQKIRAANIGMLEALGITVQG